MGAPRVRDQFPGASKAPNYPTEESTRISRGLEQFVIQLQSFRHSSVIDMGVANQANINYVTDLGHRITSDNVIHILDSVWSDSNLNEASRIDQFLEQALGYQGCSVAGVLIWDTLQFLPPALLEAVVERLYHLLESGGLMLAYFHAEEKARTVPCYSYRIVDGKSLMLTPRGLRNREPYLNNRDIERIFQKFSSVKFFLTRDHLREIIVKR